MRFIQPFVTQCTNIQGIKSKESSKLEGALEGVSCVGKVTCMRLQNLKAVEPGAQLEVQHPGLQVRISAQGLSAFGFGGDSCSKSTNNHGGGDNHHHYLSDQPRSLQHQTLPGGKQY